MNTNLTRLRQFWFTLRAGDSNIEKIRECARQLLQAGEKDPPILRQIEFDLAPAKIGAERKKAAIRRAKKLVGYLQANAAHLQAIYIQQDVGEIRSIINQEGVDYGEIGISKAKLEQLLHSGRPENGC